MWPPPKVASTSHFAGFQSSTEIMLLGIRQFSVIILSKVTVYVNSGWGYTVGGPLQF